MEQEIGKVYINGVLQQINVSTNVVSGGIRWMEYENGKLISNGKEN